MVSVPVESVTRLRASMAFLLGTVFFGYAFTQRVAPSVMTNELMRDFAVGGAALGSLSAFYFYAYAGIQLPVGLLVDRFGPRKLMSFALILCALACLGFAYSDSLATASLARLIIGGAVGFGFVGTLAIAAYWFPSRRFALLSGILMTVGMLGAILGQAPLRIAVEHLGWRATILSLAVVAVVLAILIFIVVPRRSPKQLALGKSASPFIGLKAVMSNLQTWMCAGVGFGSSASLLGFSGLWAVPWLGSVKGFPLSQAAGIASAVFLGWAIAAPVFGWLSDHIGRRKPIILSGLVINILSFSTLIFTDIQSGALLSILFFATGLGGSAMIICYGVVREHNAPQNNATALAFINMCVVGAGAVMQPLVGWVLDLKWAGEIEQGARIYGADAYTTGFLFILGASILGLLCGLLLVETYCRPQVLDPDADSE